MIVHWLPDGQVFVIGPRLYDPQELVELVRLRFSLN